MFKRFLVVIGLSLALLPLTASARRRSGSSSGRASKGYSSHSPGRVKGSGVKVKGYTKKSGAYVAPHRKTAPNKTQRDNYGTKGNVNPYTGKTGTVEPKK